MWLDRKIDKKRTKDSQRKKYRGRVVDKYNNNKYIARESREMVRNVGWDRDK